MDELANNVYSTLNQLNFSAQFLADTNNFLTKYVNTEVSITDRLNQAFLTPNTETPMRLYSDISFNSLFISSITFFENYARLLMESVSYYLTTNGTTNQTLKSIHESYCKYVSIKND